VERDSEGPQQTRASQPTDEGQDPQPDQPDQTAKGTAPALASSSLSGSADNLTSDSDPQFSPDGKWWWDGAQWQASHLSDDGKWWWSGSAWQPYPSAGGLLAESPASPRPGKTNKGDLKSAREDYRLADKTYKEAIKAAELKLRQAQEVHATAVSNARKKLGDAEAVYTKAVRSAQQTLSEWTAPGTGRRIDSYQGITLFEHSITTPQGSASLHGASVSVDTAGNLAVTKRVTLTRLVAGGIIGGLIFQKKSKDDSRELYIVIETPTVVSAVKCPPDQGPKARQLAAKVQQQVNWETSWLNQRETARPRAAAYLEAAKKNTSQMDVARVELARALTDATYLNTIGASRTELANARSDIPRLEAAGARLLALGEHVQEIRHTSAPPLDKLNSKEEERLHSQLNDGEQIISSVVGKGGQACVATDRRVLIIKLNLTAGASKGATGLAYSEIAAVRIRTSLGSGEIEFHKAEIRSTASEIAISFDGSDEVKFREFEVLVAGRATEALRSSSLQLEPSAEGFTFAESEPADGHAESDSIASSEAAAESDNLAQGGAQISETAPQEHKPDRYAQLRLLGDLRAQGVLTEEEFQAEKARILAG
jgi:Short C-terminal domain